MIQDNSTPIAGSSNSTSSLFSSSSSLSSNTSNPSEIPPPAITLSQSTGTTLMPPFVHKTDKLSLSAPALIKKDEELSPPPSSLLRSCSLNDSPTSSQKNKARQSREISVGDVPMSTPVPLLGSKTVTVNFVDANLKHTTSVNRYEKEGRSRAQSEERGGERAGERGGEEERQRRRS